MKEYIKKFESVSDANDYVINDIPFTSTIGVRNPQNLVCNEEGKKLIVEGDEIKVVDDGKIVTITYKDTTRWIMTNDDLIDGTIVSHEFSNGSGTIQIQIKNELKIKYDRILSPTTSEVHFPKELTPTNNLTEPICDTNIKYNYDDGLYISPLEYVWFFRDVRNGSSFYYYDNSISGRPIPIKMIVDQYDGTTQTFDNLLYENHWGWSDIDDFTFPDGTAGVLCLWGTCITKDTPITLADGTTKLIQDITYDDELLVWDFDNATYATASPLWVKTKQKTTGYWLCKFSDGSELKLTGPKSHRLFNYTDQRFDYSIDCVGKEIYTENGIITLLSCKFVIEKIDFYNIITNYHMNLFANHILTSCRYNNVYKINDMKFVKENRDIIPSELYNVPDKYYFGMRLGEQTIPINETKLYISRLLSVDIANDRLLTNTTML